MRGKEEGDKERNRSGSHSTRNLVILIHFSNKFYPTLTCIHNPNHHSFISTKNLRVLALISQGTKLLASRTLGDNSLFSATLPVDLHHQTTSLELRNNAHSVVGASELISRRIKNTQILGFLWVRGDLKLFSAKLDLDIGIKLALLVEIFILVKFENFWK
ncbi:hypothetical protein COP2_022352 [Malus domestica]